MKKIFLVFVGLFLCSTVYAKDALWQLVIDSQTVNATASITSAALVVGSYSDFSYVLTIESGSAPDVQLEVQVIDSNTSSYSLLASTSDVSVDSSYYGTWTDLNTSGVLDASHTSGKIADGFSLPVTRIFRFKITGIASNGADTVVSLTLGRYAER